MFLNTFFYCQKKAKIEGENPFTRLDMSQWLGELSAPKFRKTQSGLTNPGKTHTK